jgi:hypothetical protein
MAMKQDYTTAYLRHVAGLRPSVPQPQGYRPVVPDGSTTPSMAEQGRAIRSRIDTILTGMQAERVSR